MHADWFGAWNDDVMDTWHANCINKRLNCSAGVLGDGTALIRNKLTGDRLYKPTRVPLPENVRAAN